MSQLKAHALEEPMLAAPEEEQPMMYGFGYGGWQTMGWMAVNSLFWLLLIVLAVFLIVRIMHPGDRATTASARQILEERYAKGDIPREEYLQKKKDILAQNPG